MLNDDRQWTGAVLEIDIDVTRRKRFHYLTDRHGNVVAVHQLASDAFDALTVNEIDRVLVLTEKSAYIVEVKERPDLHPKNGADLPHLMEPKDTKHHG